MPNENINWEKKDNLNFTTIINKLNEATDIIVKREINDIKNKIIMLQKMGLIKNDKMIEAGGEGRISTSKGMVRVRPIMHRKDLVASLSLK